MKRKLYKELLEWKKLKDTKMPLLLYGARQVGKTYLIKEFGEENYKNVVYVNFEKESGLLPYFNSSLSPDKIIRILENYFGATIVPYETLIIFDEIQTCSKALTSLKYFAEDAPEYDLIAAGSLLGVAINSKDFSFPVGKVIIKTLYPLDFEEFLIACGKGLLIDEIKRCFLENVPIDETLHLEALQLYKNFMLVGGMPLAVKCYIEKNSLTYADIQNIVIDTYTSDMTKYSDKSQSLKTISTYESILPQISKENRKFQYSLIQKGARASIFGDSIDWLIRAGIVIKCDKTIRGDVPPATSVDLSSFKLYLNDIGLLSCKAQLTEASFSSLNNIFLGGITENYVATMLRANKYDLYYWESNSKAEVDFVIIKDGKVIPIEVKSSEHNKSKSLDVFKKLYSPEYCIRISNKNFGFYNNIKAVPLYAVFCI